MTWYVWKWDTDPLRRESPSRVTDRAISETAPAPRDTACVVRSMFCGRPKRTRLRIRKPAWKRLVLGTKPAHARLKWRRCCEFEKHVAPCEPVYRGPRAARRKYCSRDAQSGSPGRHGRSPGRHSRSRLRCKPRGAVCERVTSPGISQHELRVSGARCFTWQTARERAVVAINGATLCCYFSPKRKGHVNCRPPPW